MRVTDRETLVNLAKVIAGGRVSWLALMQSTSCYAGATVL